MKKAAASMEKASSRALGDAGPAESGKAAKRAALKASRKKKEELAILREIKRLTDEYNMMRMIVRSYDEKADALEIRITNLISSLDN